LLALLQSKLRSVTDLFNPAQPVAGLVSNLIRFLTIIFLGGHSKPANEGHLRTGQ
jgi:hypothetical protein